MWWREESEKLSLSWQNLQENNTEELVISKRLKFP